MEIERKDRQGEGWNKRGEDGRGTGEREGGGEGGHDPTELTRSDTLACQHNMFTPHIPYLDETQEASLVLTPVAHATHT